MKLKYLGIINKELNRLTITAVALAVVAIVGVIGFVVYQAQEDHLELITSETIDETPTLIQQMNEIGEWEFLAINDEELVDTTRRELFTNDELVRIYYGTLRLGIDFSKFDNSWIEVTDDTVKVFLPEVALLDKNFIDEAKSKAFFEKGRWSNNARKALYEKARRMMLKRCLTKENKRTAQQNAEEQVKAFLEKLTEKRVIVGGR